MDIILFSIFLTLSLVLVCIGFWKSEHTELCLIGFLFMFLLSLVLMNSQLEMVVGSNTTSNFSYSAVGNNTFLTSSFEDVDNIYGAVNLNGLERTLGYWLAVSSVICFIIVLINLKRTKQEDF